MTFIPNNNNKLNGVVNYLLFSWKWFGYSEWLDGVILGLGYSNSLWGGSTTLKWLNRGLPKLFSKSFWMAEPLLSDRNKHSLTTPIPQVVKWKLWATLKWPIYESGSFFVRYDKNG
jgi:hypothetical protein